MTEGMPGGESRPADPRRDPRYEADLRERVLTELAQVKGRVELAAETRNPAVAKEQLRIAHSAQRAARLADAAEWLTSREPSLLGNFANGSEIEPSLIDPVVVPVRTPADVDLFRFATLQWSVPVSSGYGRRNRFLIRDRQNGKLIGIFAMGDPVIAQGARDEAIGWTKEHRNARLYNVYDAFVLGAVEPYRQLLAGKLAALLTISNEVRDFLRLKYLGSETQIAKVAKDPTPVLVTTSSALGRSSVYNRITYEGALMFHPVGFTKGYGHFQFSDELFAELLQFVRSDVLAEPGAKVGRSSYGSGPNWRFRVIRTALKALEIPEEYLQHNVKREVFLAPAAHGWRDYLRGERPDYEPFDLPTEKMAQYYRERWAVGRAGRMPAYRFWRREEARLTPLLRGRQLTIGVPTGPTYGRVDLGAYSVAVGTELLAVHGKTIAGVRGTGSAYLSRVEGPGLAATVADISWGNGEREVRGWERGESAPEVEDVIGRLRIGIAPSERFRNMSVAEIRPAKHGAEGKPANALKTSATALSETLGFDVGVALDSIAEATVGTRAELLREEGPRRGQLCVLFPAESRVLPAVLWALIRPLSLALADPEAPRPSAPVLRRAAPALDEMEHGGEAPAEA